MYAHLSKNLLLHVLLIILASLPAPVRAHPLKRSGTRGSENASGQLKQLRAAARALSHEWQVGAPAGETWTGINAWQRFVIIDALARYTELTGDRTYLRQIEGAVSNLAGLDGNDDDLWAVIASLHVYHLDQSQALLEFSKTKFSDLTNQYWDQTCGGGMWWDHQRTYKNAITNELFFYAATMLYRATNDPDYLNWAHKTWAWFRDSTLINNRHMVVDGLNAQCKCNGGSTYTYNQGVVLGGLMNLYEIEGDPGYRDTAILIARAAIRSLSIAGILHEPVTSLNQDGQAFKGIFVYYLSDLIPHTPSSESQTMISHFLRHNAFSVWKHRQRNTNKLDAYWSGNAVLYGASAQAAGLQLLEAAYRAITAYENPRNGTLWLNGHTRPYSCALHR